ncbi:hypothetical protein GCM10028857_05020 [Salinarchaeum chitinilyticum]
MSDLFHLDLCAGTGGWQARTRGSSKWDVLGVDVVDSDRVDLLGDVRQLEVDRCPDLVTASPPCVEVTKYRLPWYGDGVYSGDPDLSVHAACFSLIRRLEPRYWVVENVLGFGDFYGPPDTVWGPWRLWHDLPVFDPGPVQYKYQNQTPHAGVENAAIPEPLAESVTRSVEVMAGV